MLHLKPHVQAGRLECNTARTVLLLDHEPLPWARWGEEFATVMPEEISRLQERAARADGVPRHDAIRNRVSAILPLYRLSRYRPTRPPDRGSEHTVMGACGRSPADVDAPRPPVRGQLAADAAGAAADLEQADERSDDKRPSGARDSDGGPETTLDLPDVAWISARDGSRAPGDLEDQAARYHQARNELTINADFRAIGDLITHWRERYRSVPGSRTVIEAQVHEWCEQVLVEVVLAGRNSRWSKDQLDALLSPTSLSAALLPRHLLHSILQKRLAQKLGTPTPMAETATASAPQLARPAGTVPDTPS